MKQPGPRRRVAMTISGGAAARPRHCRLKPLLPLAVALAAAAALALVSSQDFGPPPPSYSASPSSSPSRAAERLRPAPSWLPAQASAPYSQARAAGASPLPSSWSLDEPGAADPFRLITKRQSAAAGEQAGPAQFSSASSPLNAMASLRASGRPPATTTATTASSGPMATTTTTAADKLARRRRSEPVCDERLCSGLPAGCLDRVAASRDDVSRVETSGSLCTVLFTSKYLIDPFRPVARDIHFELVALPAPGGRSSNYAAVGFSETGRMAGFVSECLQYRNPDSNLHTVRLAHSYNVPGGYNNVPVSVLAGIKNLGVSFENGYYQCRWVVESAVEFTYEDANGTTVQLRADLGYKDHHILLATGEYNELNNFKSIHSDRISSSQPISLARTNGHVQSLGAPLLIRIHGSLMIAIWIGLVTLSILLARYYKNEWANSKINELAIWFVLHRALMLVAWFGSLIAVIFAYMHTETYHAGLHQLAGSACLILSTVQVLGGLLRPSNKSNKRPYFNWAHFVGGNLSYLFAMVSIITAAWLAPARLPPLYIWVVAAFVAVFALTHLLMTVHQYIAHKSSKISITPMSDLNDTNSSTATYSSCGFVADSYPKETSSTFRQVMLGILVTVVVIFIVLLISLVNIK